MYTGSFVRYPNNNKPPLILESRRWHINLFSSICVNVEIVVIVSCLNPSVNKHKPKIEPRWLPCFSPSTRYNMNQQAVVSLIF